MKGHSTASHNATVKARRDRGFSNPNNTSTAAMAAITRQVSRSMKTWALITHKRASAPVLPLSQYITARNAG